MFNVVAHDIRDPLAVLINLMELMEEEMRICVVGAGFIKYGILS
jgi:signal transduction histidine kinase